MPQTSVDQNSELELSILPNNQIVQMQQLDPSAQPFKPLASSKSMSSAVMSNLGQDWNEVQQVSAGGLGSNGESFSDKWLSGVKPRRVYGQHRRSKDVDDPLLPLLPFMDDPDLSAFPTPAKPVLRTSDLSTVNVALPSAVFEDRALPAPCKSLAPHPRFTPGYFVALGNLVSASGFDKSGFSYPAGTPNFRGARIPLAHLKLKIDRWRHHLIGYEHVDLLQHLQFGFPLGLQDARDVETTVLVMDFSPTLTSLSPGKYRRQASLDHSVKLHGQTSLVPHSCQLLRSLMEEELCTMQHMERSL